MDEFVASIERRRKQLDELLASYRQFKEKLDALPPEMSLEAKEFVSETVGIDEPAKPDDLSGKSARMCCTIILTERANKAQHYSDLAKEAMSRGYQSPQKGNPEHAEVRTFRTFWAMMALSSEFQAVGRGYYRLRNWQFGSPEEETTAINRSLQSIVCDAISNWRTVREIAGATGLSLMQVRGVLGRYSLQSSIERREIDGTKEYRMIGSSGWLLAQTTEQHVDEKNYQEEIVED